MSEVAPFAVTECEFVPASDADAASGLIGWANFVLNGALKINSVSIRRTLTGSVALSWPKRKDRHGDEHTVIHPITKQAQQVLDDAILGAVMRGARK